MIFVYQKWDKFCNKLSSNGIKSIPACEVGQCEKLFILKHDVETNVKRAYKLAKIENKYGHRGSYYVQVYLLNDKKNIDYLKKMQEMGHEISYHYDVMDSNQGDIEKAIVEFENNKNKFEEKGFPIITVCQHGNPIIERKGYASNRDFFRNEKVQTLYPNISDIMVDYAKKRELEYTYYSDAGRKFRMIFDPLTNDIVNSEDKNIDYKNLDKLFSSLADNNGTIISTHPHRWRKSRTIYVFNACVFSIVKTTAKIAIKIPFIKKFVSKHYGLAKKF